MNSSNCKRNDSNLFRGMANRAPVYSGNLMADVPVFLFSLGMQRGTHMAVGNPPTSFCWRYPLVSRMLDGLGERLTAVTTYRCAFTQNAEGTEPQVRKPYRFVSSAGFFKDIRRECPCLVKHVPLVDRQDGAVTRCSPPVSWGLSGGAGAIHRSSLARCTKEHGGDTHSGPSSEIVFEHVTFSEPTQDEARRGPAFRCPEVPGDGAHGWTAFRRPGIPGGLAEHSQRIQRLRRPFDDEAAARAIPAEGSETAVDTCLGDV